MSIPFNIVHVVMARDGGVIKVFSQDEAEAADALALELGALVVDAYEPRPQEEGKE